MWPALCTTTSRRPLSSMIFVIAAFADVSDKTSSSPGRRSALLSAANFAASCTCSLLRPEVSRMLAYTTCPALASARAASAPKPLEVHVTQINFFIILLLEVVVFFLKKDLEQTERDLDHSAICVKHLAVDPTPVRAGQE